MTTAERTARVRERVEAARAIRDRFTPGDILPGDVLRVTRPDGSTGRYDVLRVIDGRVDVNGGTAANPFPTPLDVPDLQSHGYTVTHERTTA